MPDPTEKKSKWGGLFHKDRPSSTADSTYGSEGSRDSYNNGNPPSVSDSNASRNSNNNSHPVEYVNEQGQVVTTTTTTTTTTTSGGGNARSSTTPHDSNLANKLDPRVNTDNGQPSERRSEAPPNVPAKSSMRRDPSPNPTPQQIRQANAMGGQAPQQRDGQGGYSGNPAQGNHNFSYPSRGGTQAQTGQPSTLQGVKAAAVGLHVSLHTIVLTKDDIF